MSIGDHALKIKLCLEAILNEWGIIALIALIGFAAFGLGRLSAEEIATPAVGIEAAPELKEPQGLYVGGLVVASKTGSVYYFPWCPGGEHIDLSMQMWFASESAAQKAGYKPAEKCKGLIY